ncbi:urease accessory protein UreD [Piscinibacter sp.]|jgi:urease accessory protein|uniref:urease accessory protein UreD n=1 Tax=Piscinibacter sp. TaxID=1903157 RepID=UPI00355A1CEF
MGWHGRLDLRYRRDGDRSVVHDRHSGPLRVLASLYPEAPGVCHNVLVHPPGGIVGGDVLAIDAELAAHSHALITTPGATRFYRSAGETALQTLDARLADGARLEWLPLETICHRGALAENRMRFELAPGAEAIGWDVLALGLPASGEAFDGGRFTQHIELPGIWLERGTIDGSDSLLLDSPLGWAGQRVMATMWFAAGSALAEPRRDALLDAAREVCAGHPLQRSAGSTSPHAELVLLRVLAPRVEPAMALLVAVWRRWREAAWGLCGCAPRVWQT